MDLGNPLHALFPSTGALALQALVSNPGSRSGREVARLAGVSHPAATRALDSLAEQGVVTRERASRANMYRLNEEHLAVAPLRDLAGIRALLVERLKAEVEQWAVSALHVSLFGSVARDGGTADSDVDLLVVRPPEVSTDDAVWRAQIEALAESVFRWTGNHVGLSEVGPSDLARSVARGQSGAASAADSEGVRLGGYSLRDITEGRVG